jgi:hypothetical protein
MRKLLELKTKHFYTHYNFANKIIPEITGNSRKGTRSPAKKKKSQKKSTAQ